MTGEQPEPARCTEKGCCFRGPVCPVHGRSDEEDDRHLWETRGLMRQHMKSRAVTASQLGRSP